jgi:uncharacterized OB-fold protein
MTAEEGIRLLRCEGCGKLHVPPTFVCAGCGEEDLRDHPADGSGAIYSFTTIQVAPSAFRSQVPYDIALVRLKEGLKVTARVRRGARGTLSIGDPARFLGKDDAGFWFQVE